MTAPPIDLSDLDPFAPPSGTTTPLFASPQLTTPSTDSLRAVSPLPPPRLEAHSTGSDPLGGAAISLMDWTSPKAGPGSQAGGGAPDPVRAHEERQQAIWGELSRQPWEQTNAATSSSNGAHAIPIASTSTGESPTRRTRRRSPSRSSSISFSPPPRRLSGLMENTHPSHALRASSETSRGETALFHPASPPLGGAESAFRRARDSFSGTRPSDLLGSASPSSSGFEGFGTAVSGSGGEFGEWTDFHSAISDAVAEDFDFPRQGFSPPKALFSNSNNISFPAAGGGIASTHKAPPAPVPALKVSSGASSRTASNAASSRPSPKPSHTVPQPTNGKSKPAGPGEKGWKKEWTYDATGADAVPGIKLLGRRDDAGGVLSEDIAEGVRPHLPPRHRLNTKWTLLYSLDQHGTALSTLYSRCVSGMKGVDGGCVVVIRDARGDVFGAYVSEAPHEQPGYYGDGTCFLFKSTPFPAHDFRVGSSVRHFSPTGVNSYFVLSEAGFLSVGGGDGRFGLWVDNVLDKGVTGRCPCFGNEPLTGQWDGEGDKEQGRFEVMAIECWRVGM